MNIPRVPQLPQQFVSEAPTFVLDYIQEVMAWGNMGWDKACEKEARVEKLEAWVVDEVDPMNLSEPRRSEWHTLHEKLHPENYN